MPGSAWPVTAKNRPPSYTSMSPARHRGPGFTARTNTLTPVPLGDTSAYPSRPRTISSAQSATAPVSGSRQLFRSTPVTPAAFNWTPTPDADPAAARPAAGANGPRLAGSVASICWPVAPDIGTLVHPPGRQRHCHASHTSAALSVISAAP